MLVLLLLLSRKKSITRSIANWISWILLFSITQSFYQSRYLVCLALTTDQSLSLWFLCKLRALGIREMLFKALREWDSSETNAWEWDSMMSRSSTKRLRLHRILQCSSSSIRLINHQVQRKERTETHKASRAMKQITTSTLACKGKKI